MNLRSEYFLETLALKNCVCFRIALYIVLGLIVVFVSIIILLNILQKRIPTRLPQVFRTWNFLPKFIKSLEPYDRIMSKLLCCKTFNTNDKITPSDINFKSPEFFTEIKVIEKQNESGMNEKPKITITSF